jgi:hypothetical protein
LALALDRELQLRAQDLGALVSASHASLSRDSAGRFVERGESYAQLVASNGCVLDATEPLGRSRLLTADDLLGARHRPIYRNEPSVRGLNEPSHSCEGRHAPRAQWGTETCSAVGLLPALVSPPQC